MDFGASDNSSMVVQEYLPKKYVQKEVRWRTSTSSLCSDNELEKCAPPKSKFKETKEDPPIPSIPEHSEDDFIRCRSRSLSRQEESPSCIRPSRCLSRRDSSSEKPGRSRSLSVQRLSSRGSCGRSHSSRTHVSFEDEVIRDPPVQNGFLMENGNRRSSVMSHGNSPRQSYAQHDRNPCRSSMSNVISNASMSGHGGHPSLHQSPSCDSFDQTSLSFDHDNRGRMQRSQSHSLAHRDVSLTEHFSRSRSLSRNEATAGRGRSFSARRRSNSVCSKRNPLDPAGALQNNRDCHDPSGNNHRSRDPRDPSVVIQTRDVREAGTLDFREETSEKARKSRARAKSLDPRVAPPSVDACSILTCYSYDTDAKNIQRCTQSRGVSSPAKGASCPNVLSGNISNSNESVTTTKTHNILPRRSSSYSHKSNGHTQTSSHVSSHSSHKSGNPGHHTDPIETRRHHGHNSKRRSSAHSHSTQQPQKVSHSSHSTEKKESMHKPVKKSSAKKLLSRRSKHHKVAPVEDSSTTATVPSIPTIPISELPMKHSNGSLSTEQTLQSSGDEQETQTQATQAASAPEDGVFLDSAELSLMLVQKFASFTMRRPKVRNPFKNLKSHHCNM